MVESWWRGDGDLIPLTEGGGMAGQRRDLCLGHPNTEHQPQGKQEAEVGPAGAWGPERRSCRVESVQRPHG